MQSTINIDGKDYLVGLNWQVVAKSGAARKKDINAKRKETGQTYGVTVDGEDVSAIGFCNKPSKVLSAAAIFAHANQEALKKAGFADENIKKSWMVVEDLGNGKFWLCAVADGVPVPGTDIIDEFNMISAKIADFIDIIDSAEIFSTSQKIQEYVAEVSPAQSKTFNEIVEDVSAAALKVSKTDKIGGIPKEVMVGGLCLILGVVGWQGWTIYQAQEIAKEKARKALQKKNADIQNAQMADSAMAKRIAEENQKAIDASLMEVSQSLSMNVRDVVNAWDNKIGSLPLTQSGWEMSAIKCGISDCSVMVKKGKLGNNAFLLQRFPTAVIDGDTATYGPISLNISQRQAALTGLPQPKEMVVGFIAESQILNNMPNINIKVDVSPSKELTYVPKAPPPPTEPGAAPGEPIVLPPAPIGVAKGEFTIVGTGLWQIKDIAEMLDRPGVGVSELEIVVPAIDAMANGLGWRIKGTYYVAMGVGPALDRGIGKRLTEVQTLPSGTAGVVASNDEKKKGEK